MKCRMLKSNRKAWEHELKTTLLPVYFPEINEREQREYEIQKERMQKLYGEDTVFLPAVPIGEACTAKADMIVFFSLSVPFSGIENHWRKLTYRCSY